MKFSWSKTVFPIAAIFSVRLLGLFLLIPVFTLYANQLSSATPTLIGFALGCYGLTQGLLQIPFGMLSDILGRKPIITFGLILFALGSLLGALAHSIYGLIIARILQGGGAIGSVLIALLADLTPIKQRTKAMAIIGMTIGISFGLAIIISPILSNRFGLAGIFYLCLILAVVAIGLLHWLIPNPKLSTLHSETTAKRSLFFSVLKSKPLAVLDAGIFCQHFILTATFFAIPLILKEHHLSNQAFFYLILMLGSFILMMLLIFLAEKKQWMNIVFLMSVLLIILSQALLIYAYSHWISLCASLFAYFVAFNFLEAALPSLVSKQANANNKGTAMGVYSTGQFLGIFAGGFVAGFMVQWLGFSGIFIANTTVAAIWFILSLSMKSNTLKGR